MINRVKHGLDCRDQRITEETPWRPGVFLSEESALQCIAGQFRDVREKLKINPVSLSIRGWVIDLWVVTDTRADEKR